MNQPEIKKFRKYLPKDPNFRHGFKAQISKLNMRLGRVWYFVGGQKFEEPIENFREKYEVVE